MLPWKETSVESERLRFIERVTAGEEPVTELCRAYGISRKTSYKLIHRYEAHGEDGLLDRSRAPHDHPNATPRELAERIVEAKRAHPTWGPKKLIAWLRDIDPDVPWPAPSTAGAILDRAGLVQRRRRRRRASPWNEPFAHAIVPNDVWCIDFKGWFRTGDGTRVDPLTVQDAACPGSFAPTTAALRRRRPGQPLTPLRMVDQARDRPRAHRAGTPRTERASRAPPPHPQGGDGVAAQGQPETAAASLRPLPAQLQQRATPRGPGTATAGQALHPLVPALSLTPQLAGIRGRGHRAPSAPQRRDQVEGGQSLCERVSSGRAHRPRPARRAHLVDTVRTPPHRRPRRPRAADRQDPGTRVTYVPGLTVTHVPGRTRAIRESPLREGSGVPLSWE